MSEVQENKTIYVFGDFCFKVDEKCLFRKHERLDLTPRNFALLLMLVENSGHLLEKEILMNEVWGNTNVEEGNLTRTISNLRKILGDTKEQSVYIQTVPRVGYRFIADVKTENPKAELEARQQEISRKEPVSESTIGLNVVLPLALLLILIVSIFAVVNWKSDTNADRTQKTYKPAQAKRLTNTSRDEQVTGWTNDGKLRFVRKINSNQAESFLMNPDGTNQTNEELSSSMQIGVWSPKGNKVVYSKNGEPSKNLQYLADADGANETKLPLKTENPMWSSDGENIVFQSVPPDSKNSVDFEIYLYNVGSAKLSKIAKSPGFDGDASFSPDGREIVFVSTRDGDFEIYRMNVNGENVRRLTHNSAHDSFPKFTSDGTGITFSSNIDGESTDIYFMKTDGSNLIRLTDWNSNELTRASCSPDGTKIAFNSDKDGNDEIYIMDFDPNKAELFLEDKNASLQTPSFSKDGKKLIYSAGFSDKTGELRVLDTKTSRIETILNTTSGSNYPRFSPDGNKIAFHQEINKRWDVFTVNSDGKEKKNLTNNNTSDSIPNWTPDGQQIIFRSNRTGESLSSEFYSMKADGTNQKPLLIKRGSLGWSNVSPDGKEIVYSCDREAVEDALLDICIAASAGSDETILLSKPDNDMQPVFSPDGRKIAFVATSDGNPEIYIINRDGSDLYRLTRNPSKDLNPVFSADGRKIVFSSDRNGSFALYRVVIPA